MKRQNQFFSVALGAFLLICLLSACATTPASQPAVIIVSPPSGGQFQAGQPVAIQSTSADPQGIVRVELLVDGNIVRTDASPSGQPQVQLSLLQTWTAVPGTHLVVVRATNPAGATGQSAVNVTVQEQAAQNTTATPTLLIAPTDTPAGIATTTPPTPTATNTSPPPACIPDSQFIADVTIPDGTTVAAGSNFVKTWRVRNSGSCAWDNAYTIVRVAGEQMGATSPSIIPATAVGATADISIAMAAPASPGAHSGTWRLRSSGGVIFGTNLTVVMNVPGAPAAATNTPTPSATPKPTPTNTQTPIPDWPLVKQGDTGAVVTALQYLLRFRGQSLGVDGIFGPQTRNAVVNFQTAKGLAADGIVGPNTWSALIQGVLIQQGSTGDAVRAAQHLLSAKFNYSIAVDGIFGPKTDAAVRDFQASHPLVVDGIVGPKTWQALIAIKP